LLIITLYRACRIEGETTALEAARRSLELKPSAPTATIKSDAAAIAARRTIARLLQAEANALKIEM
jgi:hypothetical protein